LFGVVIVGSVVADVEAVTVAAIVNNLGPMFPGEVVGTTSRMETLIGLSSVDDLSLIEQTFHKIT
jgi:hypothetical protein